jgi:hypothetical protein
MGATTLLIYVFVSDKTVDESSVTVASYRTNGELTTSVKLHDDILVQYSGDPEVMADLFDTLAARVRDEHALWLERGAAPATDPAPEGDPT